MTKRVLLAVGILLLAFALSTAASLYASRTAENLLRTGEAALLTADPAAVQRLSAAYARVSPFLDALLDAPQMEALQLAFFTLDLTDRNDPAALSAALRSVCAALRSAAEGEKLKKENIF